MKLENYIKQVDIEEIYKTVIDLEGPKYPLDNWEALEEAADYIKEKLESYGIETEFQEFYLDGFEKPFKNVIGYIGDRSKPAVLLGSHYDTVRHSPGANDNLSAVAVSLEVARILSKLDNPPSVIIGVFTLEEGHPTIRKYLEEVFMQKGWMDKQSRLTQHNIVKINKKISKLLRDEWNKSKDSVVKRLERILEENEDNFTSEEYEFTKLLSDVYKEHFDKSKVGSKLSTFVVGSALYLQKVLKENIKIEYVINYDCLGWISNQENSQKPLPITEEMKPLLTFHKTEIGSTVGNFIGIMGEKNSKVQLDKFMKYCEDPDSDIPYFGLYIPYEFDIIYNNLIDTLRSDHAPFWEENIPGLFISDTANFRSPYYHTGGDTSSRIDYEVLEKITKATLKTILL